MNWELEEGKSRWDSNPHFKFGKQASFHWTTAGAGRHRTGICPNERAVFPIQTTASTTKLGND